jgi:hypothetical protein
MSTEHVAQSFQLRPQFKMVIDFSVEYDDCVAIARSDWLISGSQIEDLQAGCAQRAQAGGEDTLLVRSSMGQGRGSGANPFGIRSPAFLGKAGNATQIGNTSRKAKPFSNFFPQTIVISQTGLSPSLWAISPASTIDADGSE